MINEILYYPWPWYVTGPLIGLTVPLLLLMGNKTFGISSSMRHVCASCFPANIPFFKYDWKKEGWNLYFVAGIFIGGILLSLSGAADYSVQINPKLTEELSGYGISSTSGLVPEEIISWGDLFTVKGLLILVGGGFLIGFGSRYAGGCTSGHAIMGLSSLQWPSLVATCCFMIGGIIMANFILPLILK